MYVCMYNLLTVLLVCQWLNKNLDTLKFQINRIMYVWYLYVF